MRSPRPERPIIVSVRAPKALPKRTSSAKPRVVSAASGAGAQPAADDDAGGDGEHVFCRAADLDAAHVGRMVGPQSSPSRSPAPARAASFSSLAASVTAVGSPRATSAAKLGPERIAGAALGAHSASSSAMNFFVPRSMPLAQTMTGVCRAISGASAMRRCAHRLRRNYQKDSLLRARRRRDRRQAQCCRRCARRGETGFRAFCASAAALAVSCSHSVTFARRARKSAPAPCPRRRRR